MQNQGVEQGRHFLVVPGVDSHLVDDDSPDIVFDSLGHGFRICANARGQGCERALPALGDQLHERLIVEGGDPFALCSSDVRVEQVPHGRLVHFQVDIVAAGEFDLCAHVFVVGHFVFDGPRFGGCVAGLLHLVGQIRVRTQKRSDEFVEGSALALVVLALIGVAFRSAEEAQIGRCIARGRDRLAQGSDLLAEVFESLSGLLQAILEQSADVFRVVPVKCLAGIIVNGLRQGSEQILVVDDVAVFLVLAVEAVDPADRLEQAVVAHLLGDVEIGRGRGVKAGQQLIHHDQEFHPPRLFDESLFHLLFESLHFVHYCVFRRVEVRREHLSVNVVLAQFLGEALAGHLALDVRYGRFVRRDDGAFARQVGSLKYVEEAASRIDAVRDEQGVAATALEPISRFHVELDVRDDLLQPAP